MMNFETLVVSETNRVAHIELNRAEKANAMNLAMWQELISAFDWLSTGSARVAVLSARGKHFTAGIDLDFLLAMKAEITALPEEVRQEHLFEVIVELQNAISAAESCSKPILAAIHGACLGGGVGLVTACDMRYATHDASFSVKEVDMAIVADVGTLQRLPRLTGDGLARELAYTGREFDASEAHAIGLVNQVFPDEDSLMKHVMELAASISKKSPLTIRGIKDTLNYSRDHTVSEGLAYVAARNAATLFSADLAEAISAIQQKRAARFED
ncbi:MAG: crotonase/enoyl-CoA hydratase family protein [Gammaproteobacteria bacterium]|nr:crotonase/enoyl-CoA hydratase family protein [Gammaproteobacteria bacterium]